MHLRRHDKNVGINFLRRRDGSAICRSQLDEYDNFIMIEPPLMCIT